MSFASNTPGTEVVRMATFPLRATMLPGAALLAACPVAFCSAAPGCADPVEFEAIPARSFPVRSLMVFGFIAPFADEPAPVAEPMAPAVEPIGPVGTLEEAAELP